VQQQLGATGYAFDMNVACSSATFGIKTAVDAIKSGSARRVLVVNPELGSAVVNFCDRDSHFIFGDVATAVIVEAATTSKADQNFEVIGQKLFTQFSNNIRSNAGVLDRLHPETRDDDDKMFVQEGRKVFKEVCPLVAELIVNHLSELQLTPTQLKRLWLHQANINMNRLIASKVLGRDATDSEAPLVLDRYSNTGSAGSLIAFHFYRDDLCSGEYGLLCSFGAGYSAGAIVLRAH
jgi:beta-ketodecanoyl-[acyl-carrier-protein] synthase